MRLTGRWRFAFDERSKHLGNEHEVVILHPDERVLVADLFANRLGEGHVALAVGVPRKVVENDFGGICAFVRICSWNQ